MKNEKKVLKLFLDVVNVVCTNSKTILFMISDTLIAKPKSSLQKLNPFQEHTKSTKVWRI